MLNQEQRRAVNYEAGPIMVVAGPGTGKTRTLVAKAKKLLKSGKRVLVLTFSRKAAGEIKDRLGRHKNVWVGTFHAKAFELLKDKNLKIAEEEELKEIVAEIRKKYGLKESVKDLMLMISKFKNKTVKRINKAVFGEYEKRLAEESLVDYDDLLIEAVIMAKRLGYDWVLVDEFQDTNKLQYQMLLKILGENKKIMIIGDPRQAIYGFRGANVTGFEDFKKVFGDCKQMALIKNYRNPKKIIELSERLLPTKNKMTSQNVEEEGISLISGVDVYQEAEFVVSEIKKIIGGLEMNESSQEMDQGANFSDFAVLYRIHSLNKILKQKLDKAGIPYQVAGEGNIYEDSQVKIILEKLSKKEIEEILPLVKMNENVEKFLEVFSGFESKEAFFEYFSEISIWEYYDKLAEKVSLLTIHASKGLEFSYVFVIGFEDGLIPYSKKEDWDVAEEKRLLYVAMTRTKKNLYLLKSQKRWGGLTKKSRFEDQFLIDKTIKLKRKIKQKQISLF